MEGTGSGLQPVAVADGCLHWPGQALLGGAEGGIELVPVWLAKDKDVDIADRPLAEGLVTEMIRQAPAIDEQPPAPGELPVRVNPFDLALFLLCTAVEGA